jgi:hypothetical protein
VDGDFADANGQSAIGKANAEREVGQGLSVEGASAADLVKSMQGKE